MARKNDNMAGNVKDLIAGKVLELLKFKQMDDISVVSVVEACNISRQAFYYHYHDITEVLEYVIEKKINEAADKTLTEKDSSKNIDTFVDYYYEFYNMFKALLPSSRGFNLYISLANLLKRLLEEHRFELGLTRNIPEEKLPLQLEFYSYGIAGYMIARKMDSIEERELLKSQLKEAITRKPVTA